MDESVGTAVITQVGPTFNSISAVFVGDVGVMPHPSLGRITPCPGRSRRPFTFFRTEAMIPQTTDLPT
jgi:hypothetical protein